MTFSSLSPVYKSLNGSPTLNRSLPSSLTSPVSREQSFFQGKRGTQLPFRHYGVWRVISGYVRTYTFTEDGNCVPLGFWSSEDIFGYPVVQVDPYCVECLTAVQAQFLDLSYGNNIDAVRAQAAQYSDLLRISHCRQAEQRLLQFIGWLSFRYGSPITLGRKIHIRLSHQEIAETIGITRVTVSRLLKKLESDGQICWSPKRKYVYHCALEIGRAHV